MYLEGTRMDICHVQQSYVTSKDRDLSHANAPLTVRAAGQKGT